MFKTINKKKKLEDASERSKYNPNYHKEAEKLANLRDYRKYKGIF